MSVTRYLARKIFHEGEVHPLSVLELHPAPDYFRIYPFEREIHSTSFYEGSIYVLAPEARHIEGLNPALISRQNLWYKKSGSGNPEPPYLFFVK